MIPALFPAKIRHFLSRHLIAFAVILLAASISVAAAGYRIVMTTPVTITAVNPARICGTLTAPDGVTDGVTKTICTPDMPEVAQSIHSASDVTASDTATCARDLSGDWKCWGGVTGYTESIVAQLLGPKDGTVFSAGKNLCAVKEPLKNGGPKTITCSYLAPYNFDDAGKDIESVNGDYLVQKLGPFEDLRDQAGSDNYFCAIDGDSVKCFTRALDLPDKRLYSNPKRIAITDNSICVIDDQGMTCVAKKLNSPPKSRPEWIDAVKFKGNREGVCVIRKSGQLECEIPVPLNEEPMVAIPKDLGPITDFGLGRSHICALKTDGTVRCWGATMFPEVTAVPAAVNAARVKKLTVGDMHTCAIDTHDSITCWGTNESQQLDTPPQSGKKGLSLAIGEEISCAWNDLGARCQSDGVFLNRIPEMHEIVTIAVPASGGQAVCAIERLADSHTKAKCWGSSGPMLTPPSDLIDPTHIAVFNDYACATTANNVFCWGRSGFTSSYPDRVRNVKRLVVSQGHACVLDEYGLACWGFAMTPELVVSEDLSRAGAVLDVAVGNAHTCAITSQQTVVCWGTNESGQLDVPQLKNPKSLGAFGNTSCASDDEGVKCWGADLRPTPPRNERFRPDWHHMPP